MADSGFLPRPKQRAILAYDGGKMGVSAVPGSGKTHILSALAAKLVQRVGEGQEVLVVTMMNSAVDNFSHRIASFLRQERGLLPNVGYRVRTLHGLAVDIVRERPGLVGLSEHFDIVDEREANRLLADVVQTWVSAHPQVLDAFLSMDIEGNKRDWVLREKWPDVVQSTAVAFIKRAKDQRQTPRMLEEALARDGRALPLARMGSDIYELYQRALNYQGAVDFDDLIVQALSVLERDGELLARLQARWPYILEDEAQDSSRLQQAILERLGGDSPNWVRVGDPNQSIHTTFTTADPELLRAFVASPDVTAVPMPNSGRSSLAIMTLANRLVDWTVADHPVPACRSAFAAQHIEPTPPGDPQPNPTGDGRVVYVDGTGYASEREIEVIVQSLQRWLPDHQNESVAVLVPRNKRGFEMTDALRRAGLPFVELLQSTISTRRTAGSLVHILRYLIESGSSGKLAKVFEVWRREDRGDEALADRNSALAATLRRNRQVEDFVWPRLERDWLAELAREERLSQSDEALLAAFRDVVRRWQQAAMLPVDQLLLTLAQDLFVEASDLALAHKLATVMRQVATDHPEWGLPQLVGELEVVAKNERRFLGFEAEDTGFEPPVGQVTVTTMHKAKGLEWDRVYLMSVNNYGFPSGLPGDSYIAEKWFVRDGLNVQEEALAQLESLHDRHLGYEEGRATLAARVDYVKERLRLLYVGITRARRDLIITWNTGQRGTSQMAVPLIALRAHLEGEW